MIQPVLFGGECIGTDLSVFLNEDESTYDAYIGVALLERVPVDPKALGQKMLVGRLYNAGVKLCELRRRFGHDNRTIKKWGAALQSGDIDAMVRAFAGRGYGKKATPELIRYARQLYRDRSILNLGANYRQRIILMIEEVFAVRISASLASAIFAGAEVRTANIDSGPERTSSEWSTSGCPESGSASGKACIVQESPTFPFLGTVDFGNVLLRHAGLVLFGLWLRFFSGIERQMICQFLQGAVNVEQSKSLCHDSLRRFCESPVRGRKAQRDALDAGSSLEAVLAVYRRNALFLADGPNRGDLFYFDPHTKEYTGFLDLLKGWCGRRHAVSKVVNLDCFHTRSGRACFVGHCSPYYDLRERFFMSLEVFDRLFDEDRRRNRTFVIDRAIYGIETFGRFDRDFLITWEKGFNATGWDDAAASVVFTRHRWRNHSNDRLTYRFECQEAPWRRDPRFRRILVKATNPDEAAIFVSVLCNNPAMGVQDVVWAIFNRWLQENDFKTLDVHFGINQLDSRSFTSFEAETESFEDRFVTGAEYKKIKAELKRCEDKLAKRLLKLRKATIRLDRLKVEEDVLEKKSQACSDANLNQTDRKRARERSKQIGKIRRNKNRTTEAVRQLKNEIEAIDTEAEKLGERLVKAVRQESRLDQLIAGNYQLLDLRRKTYMDALRITASNLFKNLHQSYRAECNNYRDDHERLRLMTRCSGFLSRTADAWKVQLWLPGTLQAHTVEAMQRFADQICEKMQREIGLKITIPLITGPVEAVRKR